MRQNPLSAEANRPYCERMCRQNEREKADGFVHGCARSGLRPFVGAPGGLLVQAEETAAIRFEGGTVGSWSGTARDLMDGTYGKISEEGIQLVQRNLAESGRL